ncbi:hypothetical protein CCHR01_05774 [Colletotrichum chrysophilum]|uniref:Uncharacterized protein n=1 Tax=Colletotrichum chrysophilum TaxID=1836956 RepID=A0AAD9ANL6_9PEZI|nr:hypothetical protein CCHR01_05774 [Colletotrichum chrysophilum]
MLDPSPRPTKPPAKRLRKGHFSSSSTDYVVEGTVNGIRTEASPDTGSDECIISSHFASKLGQKPAAGTEKTITLANQKTVESTGMIEVLWKFANDPKPHSLTCWILPGSSNDFVLGSRFLRATKTLTTSMHRITKVFRSSRFRLRLLGEERQRILGAFNNQVTTALADTGSDLMLVSLDRVLSHGLSMSSGRNDRTEVELADGSRTWTCGIVKNATWRIGESPVRCDFHVLDGLPADVILSKDYLFEQNIFANHFESSFDIDSVEGISLLCGVRVIEEGLYDLDELEQEFLRDSKQFPCNYIEHH